MIAGVAQIGDPFFIARLVPADNLGQLRFLADLQKLAATLLRDFHGGVYFDQRGVMRDLAVLISRSQSAQRRIDSK